MVLQVFFVDDPEDPEWKVVIEKQPRSKRHSQEDDDVFRPESAEHVFDAAGLATPLTCGLRQRYQNPESADPSRTNDMSEDEGEIAGENVPDSEVRAATRESDDDDLVWLEQDYDEDEENPPTDEAL